MFEATSKGAQLGAADDELIVTRNELDDLNDRLYEIRLLAADARSQVDDRWEPSEILERLLDGISASIDTN